MSDMPVTPPPPEVPRAPDSGRGARGGRMLKVAVGVGAAAGVAVGATALAQAATSSSSSPQSAAAAVTASGSTTTSLPPRSHGFVGPGGRLRGPGGFGDFGPLGGGPGVLGGGSVIDGQFTLKGPNGYETIAERNGTVSDVTDTSGSTWTLTVKSADGSSGTFTVDTGTSVNGGETGIGSVKTGDTVRVIAVVSGGTATAKQVTDETVLKSNGGTWQPMRPPMGSTGNSGNGSASTSSQTAAPPV
ncbi:MAG TPA: hypothetical protein VK283_07605 [Acidimicrobiales bacterium]|nr:hypothetical protein [Acidimicrobiales bacterium]